MFYFLLLNAAGKIRKMQLEKASISLCFSSSICQRAAASQTRATLLITVDFSLLQGVAEAKAANIAAIP